MPDMLVSLLDLPDERPLCDALFAQGIELVRPLPPDKHRVLAWMQQNAYPSAASECEVCFFRQPVSCFIALQGTEILGYACYDATAPDFFGPTMVLKQHRGKGLGKALLLKALRALREEGYAYAIIGGVGPEEFYRRTVNAFVIPGSEPGIYRHFIGGRLAAQKREAEQQGN